MGNHNMRTLLNDDFAPATSEVGFIKAPLDRVATAALDWRLSLAADTSTVGHDSLDGDLPVLLNRLAPLSVARHARELFVATDSQWTAYFDSGHRGTDSAAPSHLARALGVQFVWVSCVPHVPERYGSVQLWIEGPEGAGPLRTIRSIAAVNDGGRWTWTAVGELQSFESPEHYSARRIRDRFTPELLDTYCVALGIRYFDPSFYGPHAALIEDRRPDAPPFRSVTWDSVRAELGLA